MPAVMGNMQMRATPILTHCRHEHDDEAGKHGDTVADPGRTSQHDIVVVRTP